MLRLFARLNPTARKELLHMSIVKTIHKEIGGYISTLLRKQFGKGPTSIYVTINRPFILIHFRGFTTPMEKILLKQNEWKRVLETRNILLAELKPTIFQELMAIAGWEIQEFYVDWNLQLETGTFLGVMDEQPQKDHFPWPEDVNPDTLQSKLKAVNAIIQRKPGNTETYWLSDRILLIKWTKILSCIEKALIQEGYSEVLKLIKRPLERSLFDQAGLEMVLHREIQETFLDWNFESDVGYAVFVLEAKKDNR